ncbi:ABC transporter permease [Salipiger mucosus]|uniref:Putative cell surface polysaccharide export ABC-2 transporter permease protein n=1 Tax=Salipiger mucosus DSM 16094 TaxID=1123237 RepID=S9Q5U4_9RHOB|nr:ABC transporter permease [Salipiger mucosus]EPX75422.1 putative cell surface polysaccharide export ABC-2 transporter permease protein [Salipiger mucosus DSM 16094]
MAQSDPSAPKLRRVQEALPRFASMRTIMALILREMATSYGRSPGGYLWAILEPAAGVAAMVVIFSLGFRSPPLGDNFAIYYASGLLPFLMFVNTSSKTQQAINYSRQLLAYPRVTFVDALLARFALTVLTQAAVGVIIFTFIKVTMDTRTILDLGALLNAYGMAAATGFGVGVMNCLLVSRHAIWSTVWSVITRPLMLLSGVIFLHDRIPDPYRTWLEWNPLVHAVGEARRAFYYSYRGTYIDPVFTYGLALICATVGLLFLHSYYRDLLER